MIYYTIIELNIDTYYYTTVLKLSIILHFSQIIIINTTRQVTIK